MNLQDSYACQIRLKKLEEVTQYLLGEQIGESGPGQRWWLQYITQHRNDLEAVLAIAYHLAAYSHPLQKSETELLCLVTELEKIPILSLQEYLSNEDALLVCDHALQANPRDVQAHVLRGTVLNHLGRHSQALQSLDTTVRLDPGMARAFNNRGIALLALGQASEALTSFDEALWLEPTNSSWHGNRGLALYALGRYAAALVAFDIALAQGEETAALLNNRAEALSALGRHAEAVVACESARLLDPSLPHPLSVCGLALYAQGEYATAVESFARADQLAHKQEPFFFLLQAIALLAHGARQEGLRLLASPRFVGYEGHRLLVVRTYQYLHALSRTGQLLRLEEMKVLLESGVRFPEGWWLSFEPSLAQAMHCQHEDTAWLPLLMEVLVDRQPLASLEPWPVFMALNTPEEES